MIPFFKQRQTYEVTAEQLKELYTSLHLANQTADLHLKNLIKLTRLHGLSIKLSSKSLEIIERIKDRYPYIWNECTDEEDSKFVNNLMNELGEEL